MLFDLFLYSFETVFSFATLYCIDYSVIGKRGFAFLNALEEYPHSVKQSPSSFGSFAVNESVLRNGIKLISSSNENAKVLFIVLINSTIQV